MLKIILECCKENPKAIEPVGDIDWKLFLSLTFEHKLSSHVYKNIRKVCANDVPEHVMASLRHERHKIVVKILRLSSELMYLSRIFADEHIDFISLKGPGLAAQLFDDIAARNSKDLDFLIDLDDVDRASTLLKSIGYRRVIPHSDLSPKQERYYRSWGKDMAFVSPDGQVILELHWRLFEYTTLFDAKTHFIAKHTQKIQFLDREICVLKPELNLLYLSVHGAIHGWARLFWLLDIARLSKIYSAQLDWQNLFFLANQVQGTRCLLEAMTLVSKLFGAECPQLVVEAYKKDSAMLWLVQNTLNRVTKWNGYGFFNSLSLARRTFQLNPHFSHRWYVLKRPWLPRSTDWELIHLPDSLFGLYYVLRPFTEAYRNCKAYFSFAR